MILTRAPLRITLGGGGTDVPSYYERHGGMCIAAAIDKYVYIAVHRRTDTRLVVKYSEMENVAEASELKHAIIREALGLCNLDGRGMEIVSFADIPAGTGLGSSGAFTVALLKALHAYTRTNATAHQIAEEACHIEIDLLKEPIGKQDQFIAAYGGLTRFDFGSNITATPVAAPDIDGLHDSLLLFFTGYSRSASAILAEVHAKSASNDGDMIFSLNSTKAAGEMAHHLIVTNNYDALGKLFNSHWQRKRLVPGMSNAFFDAAYERAMLNGAIGGKLVGAGGGGFLLFVASDKTALRREMGRCGLVETRFRFDAEGVKLLAI